MRCLFNIHDPFAVIVQKEYSVLWPDPLSCKKFITCNISPHSANQVTLLLAAATVVDWNVLLLPVPLGFSKLGFKPLLEK